MPDIKESCMLQVAGSKLEHLEKIARLNEETLKMLAELSAKPGIEKKLKDNFTLIKAFL